MFMEAQYFTKMFIFEQDLVWHDFMGENFQQTLAQDFPAKMLAFEQMFGKHLIIWQLAKILLGRGEIMSHPDSTSYTPPQRPVYPTYIPDS